MQKRRQFSADFKAKVAIEALKEQQTLQELAHKYEVHPNQISSWKQEFLQNSASVFTKGKKKEESDRFLQALRRDRQAEGGDRFSKKKSIESSVEEKRLRLT